MATSPTVQTSANDLQSVVSLIEWLGRHDPDGDMTIEAGSRLVLHSKHDYPIGVLLYEEDQWWFAAHDDREAT